MLWSLFVDVLTLYVYSYFRSHCEAMEKVYGPFDTRVAVVINDFAVHLSRTVS